RASLSGAQSPNERPLGQPAPPRILLCCREPRAATRPPRVSRDRRHRPRRETRPVRRAAARERPRGSFEPAPIRASSLATFHGKLASQPRLGHRPAALYRRRGNVERFGCLIDGQPAKKPYLDDPSDLGIERFEPSQRLVEGLEINRRSLFCKE